MIVFKSEVFHPFICPESKQLDTRDAFPEWDTTCHLWQLLKYLIYIFEQPEVCLSSTLNDQEEGKKLRNQEALEILRHNRGDFLGKVKKCVQASQEKVYEAVDGEDRHAIVFEEWNSNVHAGILEKIKNNQPLDIDQATATANTAIFP